MPSKKDKAALKRNEQAKAAKADAVQALLANPADLAGVMIVEAINLSNSIFDTNDISTIRGSSLALLRMVDALDEHLAGMTPPADYHLQVLTRGASTLELAVIGAPGPAGDAWLAALRDCAKAFARTEIRLGGGGAIDLSRFSIACAVASGARAPAGMGTLNALLMLARADLLQGQMQSLSFALPLDDDLPALDQDPLKRGQLKQGLGSVPETARDADTGVSHSQRSRRRFGREARQLLIPAILREGDDAARALADQLAGREFSGSLGELCPNSDEHRDWNIAEGAKGKIALIHIDGNHFGKRRAAIGTPAHKASFSALLRQLQAGILARVIQAAIGPDPVRGMTDDGGQTIRLECLLMGGDEMVIAVPAIAALELLRRIQTRHPPAGIDWFNLELGQAKKGDLCTLTHATGAVIAHHKMPIRQLREMAEQLVNLVKTRPDGRASFPVGIMVMEGFQAPHGLVEGYLKERYGLTLDGGNLAKAVTFGGQADGWANVLGMLIELGEIIKPAQLHRLIANDAGIVNDADLRKELKRIAGIDPDTAMALIGNPALGGIADGKRMALHHLRQLHDFLPLAAVAAPANVAEPV